MVSLKNIFFCLTFKVKTGGLGKVGRKKQQENTNLSSKDFNFKLKIL